ncbi:MAG: dephospho-CoA kinase [Dehalococcoidia bacterium]|nr:MAG: dephospho-CoA kinase [Dehalococcoidia bacterium]
MLGPIPCGALWAEIQSRRPGGAKSPQTASLVTDGGGPVGRRPLCQCWERHMIVIGLTGGIASGKSTAAEQLRKLGAVIIDADRVGHRSYEPGTPGFEKVVNAFGHDTVGKDGLIDRRVLGGKVFGAPQELERLNAILWPEIRRLIGEEIVQIRERDKDSVIVIEAAVLIEAGWQDLCDEVWVVTTSPEVAIERLQSRNGLTRDAALARINAQMTSKERAAYGQVVVDNSGTEEQLVQKIERAWRVLQQRLDLRRPKKPAVKKPAVKKPAVKKPAAKPVAAKPAAKKPAAKKAVAKKPVAKKPAAKKAVAKKPAAKPAVAKKPVTKKPANKAPAAKKAAAKKPAAKKPAAKKPAAKKPAAKKAVAKKPAAKPAVAKKAAKKPVAKKPARR